MEEIYMEMESFQRVLGCITLILGLSRTKWVKSTKLVKEVNPQLFSLSVCELRQDSHNFNIENLPFYNLHLPKSWEAHGYAQVVQCSKNTFDCPRIEDLEIDHIQTIWVKFGFKNSKAGYYCHGSTSFESELAN